MFRLDMYTLLLARGRIGRYSPPRIHQTASRISHPMEPSQMRRDPSERRIRPSGQRFQRRSNRLRGLQY